MIKPLMLALTFLLSAPFMAHAGEITLLPSIKLQIGDQDYRGNYWDGGRWLNSRDWKEHYRWRNNGWHRYDRGWERGRGKGHDSYIRGYRDGYKDSKKRRHGHGHGHDH